LRRVILPNRVPEAGQEPGLRAAPREPPATSSPTAPRARRGPPRDETPHRGAALQTEPVRISLWVRPYPCSVWANTARRQMLASRLPYTGVSPATRPCLPWRCFGPPPEHSAPRMPHALRGAATRHRSSQSPRATHPLVMNRTYLALRPAGRDHSAHFPGAATRRSRSPRTGGEQRPRAPRAATPKRACPHTAERRCVAAGDGAPRGLLPRSVCGALRTTGRYRGSGYVPRLGNHRGDLLTVRLSLVGAPGSPAHVTIWMVEACGR
jgi:hypothetical protein